MNLTSDLPHTDNSLGKLERKTLLQKRYLTPGNTNLTLNLQANFDINPTNPQADIATGHCEFWITNVDLDDSKPKNTPPPPPP